MGNYRFKLSDMIPNAWFYKLRDMNKSSSRKHKSPTPPPPHHHQSSTTTSNSSKPKQQFINTTPRKSYYFTREHISHTTSPRKSSSKHRPPIRFSNSRRTTATTPKPSSEFKAAEPEFRTDRVLHTDSNSNSKSSSMDDIIIDVDNNSISTTKSDINNNNNNKHLLLPPILTKPRNKNKNSTTTTPCSRRFSVSSAAGLRRLRINSPRVSGECFRKLDQANAPVSSGRRRITAASSAAAGTTGASARKKKLPDSFAIVKSSLNPQRDFRESMVEMIVENNIRSSKELEDLLACYLTLNSDEYHGLIINVFKQIWFDLTDNNSNNSNMYQQQE
ncbi:hypothetical protein PIB30_078851 [Stylosanthes scabra]|uniref:Transcription repressor n=1 Tax=Stylosanthes scabra TaxID=79078 RepID=A0ABU6WSK3_9FABA|nr:hypothetical protein [Stylosanthes scabra]